MFWLYTCMYILMVGAEVNNQYSHVITAVLKKKQGGARKRS